MKQKTAVAPDYPAIAFFSLLTLTTLAVMAVTMLLAVLCGKSSREIYVIGGIVILMFVAEVAAAAWYSKSRYAAGKQDGENEARLAVRTEGRHKPSWFEQHHRYGYPTERP